MNNRVLIYNMPPTGTRPSIGGTFQMEIHRPSYDDLSVSVPCCFVIKDDEFVALGSKITNDIEIWSGPEGNHQRINQRPLLTLPTRSGYLYSNRPRQLHLNLCYNAANCSLTSYSNRNHDVIQLWTPRSRGRPSEDSGMFLPE